MYVISLFLVTVFTISILFTIFSILYYFLFFSIFTLLTFSFSSTIFFLIQFSSPPIIVLKKISFDSLYRFLNFLIYISFNSIVSLWSTFHLLPPFLFHLNFYINFLLFHFHSSPLFLPSCPRQKRSILSLSLSPILFLYRWNFFIFIFWFQPLIFRIPIVRYLIMKPSLELRSHSKRTISNIWSFFFYIFY